MFANDVLGVALVIIGVVLLASEMAHPGAFLLVPGTTAIAAGLLFVILPDWIVASPIGPVIVVIVAIATTLATIPLYQRMAPIHRPLTTTPTSLQGEVGVVTAEVVPDSLSGKVRVRSEIWSARADQRIPVGTRVRVVGGEGVAVNVAPVEGAAR